MLLSPSENNGLALLTDQDLNVYSIGISTGGVAEVRMAKLNPRRHITASTIDQAGAEFALHYIVEQGLADQISVKIENVVDKLPYADWTFDFVYARLVLHYLPKDQLERALGEIHRVLKKGGKLFVVVRSTECPDAKDPNATFDPTTGMTTYNSAQGYSISRYFHTEKSIQDYMRAAGFAILGIKSYEEQLCSDFQRTKPSESVDALIEVFGSKLTLSGESWYK